MGVTHHLTIEKRIGEGKPWTNTYFLDAATTEDAQSDELTLVGFERDIHSEFITFTRTIIRPYPFAGGAFYIREVNLPGNRSVSDDLMPLFNTCRVLFNVLGGRPSFKYYRNLYEGDQGNAFLAGAFLTFMEAALEDGPLGLIEDGSLVDESGNGFTDWSIEPIVKMRSRTRRPRKKTVLGAINPS